MNAGQRQPPVSRCVTASVEMHCGAKTNQAEKGQRGRQAPGAAQPFDQAVGMVFIDTLQRIDGAQRRHRDLARRHAGHQRQRDFLVEADRAENRLERQPDAAGVAVFQRRPVPVRRRLRPGGERPERDGGDQDDAAGALHERHGALVQPDADIARRRPLIFRHFHQEGRARPLGHRVAQRPGRDQRADDAGDIKPEQHQPLQAERADLASPG